MPVDPGIQAMLDAIAATPAPPMHELGVDAARESIRLLAAADGEPEPVADVAAAALAGVPCRTYRAEGTPVAGAPILLWIHGGGFVIGDLDTADTTARKLANRTGALVVSVDYRLAPEHPFPAGVADCAAVLGWAAEQGVPIAVGGDSAGGNLAAVTAITARDRGIPLRHQLLVYPVTDCTMSSRSYEENASGYLLTRDSMRWFIDHYLGSTADPKDPLASPLFTDDLSGVAPATVLTAGYDPLRDEGNDYARRLAEAGVAVDHRPHPTMIHGFFAMAGITPVAMDAMEAAAAGVRAALG